MNLSNIDSNKKQEMIDKYCYHHGGQLAAQQEYNEARNNSTVIPPFNDWVLEKTICDLQDRAIADQYEWRKEETL